MKKQLLASVLTITLCSALGFYETSAATVEPAAVERVANSAGLLAEAQTLHDALAPAATSNPKYSGRLNNLTIRLQKARSMEALVTAGKWSQAEYDAYLLNVVPDIIADLNRLKSDMANEGLSPAGTPMQRLYNKNNGEHFYTGDLNEKANLIAAGWSDEGISWYAPTAGTPVYRIYNPNSGEHHYTLSAEEKTFLLTSGWQDEGLGWYSPASGQAIYRLYNPNARDAGAHHYTSDRSEAERLAALGWQDEGLAWYGTSN